MVIFWLQRRLSDPSANLNNFVRGGWKTKAYEPNGPGARTRSENDGLDSMANGLAEIEAGDVKDGECLHQNVCSVCVCVCCVLRIKTLGAIHLCAIYNNARF